MHPVILELPFGISIKAYGLMMMLGFFASTWWAMYRAQRVKADPDVILNLGFISLVSGIVGARLLYVVQFWEKDFANQPSPLMAALNVTSGGLVFYGGFLLAVICALVYLAYAKHSIRLYLDILAPSLMIGLAFGRMGCFLNGCCWGAPTQKVPWAMSFPFGWESTPFMEHWQKGLLNVPEQLLYKMPNYPLPVPIHREHIGISAAALQTPQKKLEQAQQALEKARSDKAAPDTIASLEKEAAIAKAAADKHRKEYYDLAYAYERYGLTPSDIAALAQHHRSLPVHPTQVYAIIDAVLIALLLHLVFMWRRQQGMVFGLLFILYAIGRYIEEMIRGDNPATWTVLGMGEFTMSQVISVYSLAFAIVYLLILYRLPATPATAVRAVPVVTQETKPVTN